MTESVAPCCRPIRAAPLDERDAARLAVQLRALADPVRLRVLSLLANSAQGEVCACDLVAPVGKSQPTVSHHLKTLREAGLVRAEKRGSKVSYSVETGQLEALRQVLGG